MTAGDLAVVTVSFGSEDVLGDFLQSVPGSFRGTPVIVVADNKPDGGSIERLAGRAGAVYLPLPENRGYGQAINAAVASLRTEIEWVLISNPDVVLSPAALDTLVADASTDPQIGAIGPRILNSDGSLYPSARAIPSLRTGIGHALFADLWPRNPWTTSYRNDSRDAVRIRTAGWLSGSCLLVRRAAFDAIGGFDESYFMYFEDVDLGYRLGQSGYYSVYDPAATVTHMGAHATATESKRMIRAHHESARLFISRKYSSPLLWPLRQAIYACLRLRSRYLQRRARA